MFVNISVNRCGGRTLRPRGARGGHRSKRAKRYTPRQSSLFRLCCVYSEPTDLVANTWNPVLDLDCPHVITVYVLDDGAKDEVKALAAEYSSESEHQREKLCVADGIEWRKLLVSYR